MATYEQYQTARNNFINIVGDSNSGYFGNPLMRPPLKTFTNYLETLDSEITTAGGPDASSDIYASQIKDYERLSVYISKLIISNRDSQILVDGEEFYFDELVDVSQTFGSIHNGSTRVSIGTLHPTERSVTTTSITTSPGVIATYVTPEDYFSTSSMMTIRGGVSYLELHAEKTSGEGDLRVFIDIFEVETDGTTEVGNITSELITEAVKKTHSTIVGSYEAYKIYLKVPQYTMTSLSNRIMLKIYAFSVGSTVTMKYYTNLARLSNYFSTIFEPKPSNTGPKGDDGVGVTGVTSEGTVGTVTFSDFSTNTIVLPRGIGITGVSVDGSIGTISYTDESETIFTLPVGNNNSNINLVKSYVRFTEEDDKIVFGTISASNAESNIFDYDTATNKFTFTESNTSIILPDGSSTNKWQMTTVLEGGISKTVLNYISGGSNLNRIFSVDENGNIEVNNVLTDSGNLNTILAGLTTDINTINNGKLNLTGGTLTGSLEIQKSQSTIANNNPFLRLMPNSVINETGLTSIFMSTNTTANDGISLNAQRYLSDGTPRLSIRSHLNNAVGNEVFVINNDGNVGIGKTPSVKLDVNGGLNVSGDTVLSDTTLTGSMDITERIVTTIGNDWSLLGEDIYGEAVSDESGGSISLSSDGNRIAIGAIGNDQTGGNAGHVRVYEHNGTSWVKLGNDIDGETAGDFSGFSVSLSADGSIVAIGARRNSDTGVYAGHVRVYQYNVVSSLWNKLGQDIDGEAASDGSGWSVSLNSNGTIVAIGAPDNDGLVGSGGHVRVLEFNGQLWDQLGEDIDGAALAMKLGSSVSLNSNGNIVAIGASNRRSPGMAPNVGSVQIMQYNYSLSSWEVLGNNIFGESMQDFSGSSISLNSDGNIVAIGAAGNDGNGSNSGHVRVYQYDVLSSLWNKLGNDIDGESIGEESSRVSLSSDGTIVAIGAPFNAVNGIKSGSARIMKWNGTDWGQLGETIYGIQINDEAGVSVSLSSDGTIFAVGARYNDMNNNRTNAGHVRVFTRVNTQIFPGTLDVGGSAVLSNTTVSGTLNVTGLAVFSNQVKISPLVGTGTRNLNVDEFGVITISSSDIRLKENIEPINEIESHLKLLELEPKTYNWIDRDKNGNAREIGLIAQEVQMILPELVFENTNGMYGIHYDKISILMLQSIKQLHTQIDQLENKISEMNNATT